MTNGSDTDLLSLRIFLDNLPDGPCDEKKAEEFCSICKKVNSEVYFECQQIRRKKGLIIEEEGTSPRNIEEIIKKVDEKLKNYKPTKKEIKFEKPVEKKAGINPFEDMDSGLPMVEIIKPSFKKKKSETPKKKDFEVMEFKTNVVQFEKVEEEEEMAVFDLAVVEEPKKMKEKKPTHEEVTIQAVEENETPKEEPAPEDLEKAEAFWKGEDVPDEDLEDMPEEVEAAVVEAEEEEDEEIIVAAIVEDSEDDEIVVAAIVEDEEELQTPKKKTKKLRSSKINGSLDLRNRKANPNDLRQNMPDERTASQSDAEVTGVPKAHQLDTSSKKTKKKKTKKKRTKKKGTETEQTETEGTKPEQTETEETKPEQTETEETKPEQTETEETETEETETEGQDDEVPIGERPDSLISDYGEEEPIVVQVVEDTPKKTKRTKKAKRSVRSRKAKPKKKAVAKVKTKK